MRSRKCTIRCTRVKDILQVETDVIRKHLANHKWYRHIEDENEAAIDFVWRYAWLMRESFCGKLCSESGKCQAGERCGEGFLNDISDGELGEYIREVRPGQPTELSRIQLQIVKHHVAMHKWIHHLPSYHDAVVDFLDKFGWVIDDMYAAAKSKRKS